MCTVSAIGDIFSDRWRPRFPDNPYYPPYTIPSDPTDWEKGEGQKFQLKPAVPVVTKEEFEQLRLELEALKDVIKAAKIYDEISQQKDCELESKIAFIKRIAKEVGVDFDGVFEPKKVKKKK